MGSDAKLNGPLSKRFQTDSLRIIGGRRSAKESSLILEVVLGAPTSNQKQVSTITITHCSIFLLLLPLVGRFQVVIQSLDNETSIRQQHGLPMFVFSCSFRTCFRPKNLLFNRH